MFFLLLVLFISGCAPGDIFHSRDLPEPLRPRKGIPEVSANPPDTPYQNLSWRAE